MNRTMLVGFAMIGLAACDMAKAEPDVNKADGPGGRTVAAAMRTVASGTVIDATFGETITSRSNEPGDKVSATVDMDVKNALGRVVIPAGSVVEITIAEITPARNKSREDGTLVLRVTGLTVRNESYPITAEITALEHTLKGRGVTVGEVEKVAVGTTIGAVAGRVIGGNAKGTIIGGAIGAAGGTVVAVQTASRDVVVSAGTPVTITLTAPLKVASP